MNFKVHGRNNQILFKNKIPASIFPCIFIFDQNQSCHLHNLLRVR